MGNGVPGGVGNGGALEALRYPGFGRFWWSALTSSTGTWVQTVTVPFVIDDLTNSTAWVGLAAFCLFFPPTVLAPLAGTLVDRFSRRAMLLCTQGVMVASALALFVIWTTDVATPGLILVCVVVSSVVNGVNAVTWQAAVADVVPREVLPNAVRLITAQYQAARVIGPALAGVALATVGPSGTFLADVFLFAMVLVLLVTMRTKLTRPAHPEEGVLRSFLEGVRYVRRHPACSLAMKTMGVYAFLGGPVVQLAEPITRRVYETGSGGYGLIVAAFGIGGVTGTILSLHRGDAVRRSVAATAAYVGFAAAMLVLGLVPAYAVGLVVFGLMGLGHALGAVSVTTGLFMKIEERFRGRVTSLQFLAFSGSLALGSLAQGLLANAVGLRNTVVACAGTLGALLLLLNLRHDRMRILDPPDVVLEIAPPQTGSSVSAALVAPGASG